MTTKIATVKHLVIPDAHTYPKDSLRRFEWLGNLIIEEKPNVIIQMGDFWDMPSLCSYDKGKKNYVFQNLKKDIEIGHKAEELLYSRVIDYNLIMAKRKKKKYAPLIIKLMGNHEERVNTLLQHEPQLEGTISMGKAFKTRLPLKEKIVSFKDFIIIDNIAYSHYFVSGVMGRPFQTAKLMIGKRAMSCTMGHVHTLDIASLIKPTGESIRGLIAGSFHDDELHESFAGPQVDNIWWNGVFLKHNVDTTSGNYDLEEISFQRLQRKYK